MLNIEPGGLPPVATVGAFEAKTPFPQLLQRVERGEEITITRRGKVVAGLVPAITRPDKDAAVATFRRLRQRARRSGVGSFDWAEWQAYRDQGQP
jgi:prevent-host-death family protein